jgi:hypothetical protein
MGGSRWNDDDYTTRATDRAATGTPVFAYDAAVRTGKVDRKVHELLDPKGVKFRESRDSDAHPTSNPIVVVLDETGSMGSVVKAIQKSLPKLMGLLVRKNYIPDPQVMFVAVGDASGGSEVAPLQVGQFESGLEMEDDMTRILIEGMGGGSNHESYQNAAYFIARHTVTDAWEKRGTKGYMFIIGDEFNYAKVFASEVDRLIGDKLQEDIPTKQMYDELLEKWRVFFILPERASNGGDKRVINHWKELIGPENVLELKDADAAAELIATQIGLCEGTTDVDAAVVDMKDVGVSDSMALAVAGSVSRSYAGGSMTRVAPGTLAPSSEPSGTKRL